MGRRTYAVSAGQDYDLYDESGKVSRMVGSIEDVTDMENDMLKLQKEARTDLLTGAMNRAAGTSAINGCLCRNFIRDV